MLIAAMSSHMKTGLLAMRLGIVIYFIPFFFILIPALILQGPSLWETLYLFAFCVVGIGFMVAGLEGYFLGVGKVKPWSRTLLFVAGFAIALPPWDLWGWWPTIVGGIAALLVMKSGANRGM